MVQWQSGVPCTNRKKALTGDSDSEDWKRATDKQRQKTGCKTHGGDNGIPEDVPKCRDTNSPAPTIPKIRYILLPSFIEATYEVKFTLKTGKEIKKCEQLEAQIPHCHYEFPLRMGLVQNLQQLEVSFTMATSDSLMPDLATA